MRFERIYPVPLSTTRIVLSVHDELVVECLMQDTEEVARNLKSCMETAAARILGIENLVVVDTKVSDKWEK